MPVQPLPIDDIVNIVVDLSRRSAVRNQFDLSILIGKNNVIPKEERVRTYTSVNSMLQDGFNLDDRLVKAATLMFSVDNAPERIAIGTRVTDETPVQAVQACREANSDWYICILCDDISVDEHMSVMSYTNAATPRTVYAYTTDSTAEDLAASDNSVAVKAKKLNYRRTFGQYSTKHKDAVASIIGTAMGYMTGLANSAFTLKFKREPGVEVENGSSVLTDTQLQHLRAANLNVYVNRGGQYDIFEEGYMADGSWFDEIIYLDKMENDIQLSIMDLFTSEAKIGQTEPDMTLIHSAINSVLEEYVKIGFIAEGVWNRKGILNLKKGDVLPKGYLVQSESINDQSQADRDARKAPPVYVALKLAGAIHSIVIKVDVNR